MNVNKCSILLITIFSSYCVFVHGKYNLTQLQGTWIVMNSSDVSMQRTCPFVMISNVTKNDTAKLNYISDIGNKDMTMNIRATNNTIELLDDKGYLNGNLTIFKGVLPFYMLVKINSNRTAGFSPYMVLVGNYMLPNGRNKEITEYWKGLNATHNVSTLYPMESTSTKCNQFLSISSYSEIPSSFANITPVTIGQNPMDNSVTTQKPKLPNSTNHLTSNILLTMIFVFLSLYSRCE